MFGFSEMAGGACNWGERLLQGRCRGVGQGGRIMTSSEGDAGFNAWSMMERDLSPHELWGID